MVNTILFPSSFFNPGKVDEDLQQEYDAVLDTGLFDVILFGYDKWFNEGKLVLSKTPETSVLAVQRGWMMKPEQYEAFYESLLKEGIHLITKPEHYEKMHIFPNVYDSVKGDTARMEIFPLKSFIDVEDLKNRFDRFMIKDFVKSVKGTEFPRFFDKSVTQEDFDKWMEVFYKYRGDLLTGGICVKEYLDLKQYGNRTNEYRAFYIDHVPATISRNSGQGNYTKEPPKELIDKYADLESPYYTVDFAELSDGSWRVIEAGDGSVSGLSEGQNYGQYFRALFQCLKDMELEKKAIDIFNPE